MWIWSQEWWDCDVMCFTDMCFFHNFRTLRTTFNLIYQCLSLRLSQQNTFSDDVKVRRKMWHDHSFICHISMCHSGTLFSFHFAFHYFFIYKYTLKATTADTKWWTLPKRRKLFWIITAYDIKTCQRVKK